MGVARGQHAQWPVSERPAGDVHANLLDHGELRAERPHVGGDLLLVGDLEAEDRFYARYITRTDTPSLRNRLRRSTSTGQ